MARFFRTLAVFNVGVLAGFIAAHFVNRSETGRAFLASVDAKIRDFSDGVTAGYREREAELRGHSE